MGFATRSEPLYSPPSTYQGFSTGKQRQPCLFHPAGEPTHLPLSHPFCSCTIYLPSTLPEVTSPSCKYQIHNIIWRTSKCVEMSKCDALLDTVAAVTAIHKAMGLCYEQCITGQQNLGGYYLVHRIQHCTAARTWFSCSSNTYITNNAGLVTTGMICKLQAIYSTTYRPHHIKKGNRLACISVHVEAEPGEETKSNLFFEHYKCEYCFSFSLTIISILRQTSLIPGPSQLQFWIAHSMHLLVTM